MSEVLKKSSLEVEKTECTKLYGFFQLRAELNRTSENPVLRGEQKAARLKKTLPEVTEFDQ